MASDEAKQLVSEAMAYAKYCSDYKGSVPQVVQDESDIDKIYIYYTQKEKSPYGFKKTFSDLVKEEVTGASEVKTETGEYKVNGSYYTHRKVYRRNDKSDSVQVTIKYETGREWTPELYETPTVRNRSVVAYYIDKDENNKYSESVDQIEYEKYSDNFYRAGCFYVEPCKIYTYEDYKELIKATQFEDIYGVRSTLDSWKKERRGSIFGMLSV